MRGVRKGDSLTVKWFTEATGLVEQYTFYIERDYWYYYFWTHSALFKGEPLSAYQYVTLERNGTEVIRDSFASLIDNVSKINKGNRCKEILTSLKKSELNKVKLYDYKGADISYWLQQNNDLKYLPKGIYFIEIRDENQGVCFEKIGID